ncbi:GL26119 [Drosophila persimilis]|uniref:GL26119 n=1 Tax=Drosophila persimilis TaxID=7234 RepID=B4GKM5_DROPE|nr:GL26119 [Drosophila persimilis]
MRCNIQCILSLDTKIEAKRKAAGGRRQATVGRRLKGSQAVQEPVRSEHPSPWPLIKQAKIPGQDDSSDNEDDAEDDVDAEACHLSVVCHLTYIVCSCRVILWAGILLARDFVFVYVLVLVLVLVLLLLVVVSVSGGNIVSECRILGC